MNDSVISSKQEKEEVESSEKPTNDVDNSNNNNNNNNIEEERSIIEKAMKFWNHPSLSNVSSEEKCNYLRNQCGLTEKQIHHVWEQMMIEYDNNNKNNKNKNVQ